MPDTVKADDIVSVSKHPVDALSTPRFIIQVGEKYFLTLALWEYDLSQAKTPDQVDGCNDIAHLFATYLAEGHVFKAVRLPIDVDPTQNDTATKPKTNP